MVHIPINESMMRDVRELFVKTVDRDGSAFDRVLAHIKEAAEVEAMNICLDASDEGNKTYARGEVRGVLSAVRWLEKCIMEAKRQNQLEAINVGMRIP